MSKRRATDRAIFPLKVRPLARELDPDAAGAAGDLTFPLIAAKSATSVYAPIYNPAR
jgi:hypothetical protein